MTGSDQPSSASIRHDVLETLRETWVSLARAGAVWTGAERLALAAEARRARDGKQSDGSLSAPATEAARLLAARPSAARRGWLERLQAGGFDYPHYVELVGVVSRLVAVDSFHEALGLELEPLPEPVPGEPTGEIAAGARPGRNWVPTEGPLSITNALSLVPAENAELERFHGPMYLAFDEMADPAVTRGLTRTQMELVATRTSVLNECFY